MKQQGMIVDYKSAAVAVPSGFEVTLTVTTTADVISETAQGRQKKIANEAAAKLLLPRLDELLLQRLMEPAGTS
jgi:dsRNA-specific ribonuclease